MKKRNCLIILLILICSTCFLFTACGKENLELSDQTLKLEIYEDYQITLPNGETEVNWSSSDENIATVKDGLVCCQGKIGEVVIKAEVGNKVGECKIRTVDSQITPRILGGELTCFVNGYTDVTVPLNYNEKDYTNYTVKSIKVADTSIVVSENGKLKGVTEGETTATVTVDWKGNTVKSRNPIKITVESEFSILTDAEEYDVYDVTEVSTIKKNNIKILPELWITGNKVDNATFTAEIVEGGDYFSIDEQLNVTAKSVDEKKVCKLKLLAEHNGKTVEKEVTVNVCPNYVQRENTEFTFAAPAEYGEYDQAVGGRTGVYKYHTGEKCRGSGDWIKWGNQLELATLKTIEAKSSYDRVFNELGYVLASFDVYYEGTQNAGVSEYRGVSVNAQYGPYSTDNIYYIGHTKNTPERSLFVDGEMTNTFVANKWVTFVVDLRCLDKGAQLDTYLVNNKVGDVSYVDNIRYWFDDSLIKEAEKADCVDLDKRELTTGEHGEIKAPINEFAVYSYDYTSFAKTDASAEETQESYTYLAKAKPNYGGNNLLGEEQARKIYPYNVNMGLVVKNNVKYLSFDYKYLAGVPKLFLYDQRQETTSTIALNETEVSDYKVLVFDKNGNRVDSIEKDVWYTIVVQTHINSTKNETIYFSTTREGTSFRIANVNYWKDDSVKYIVGYNDLLEVTTNNLDYKIEGSTQDINELIRATYKGKKTTSYTVENLVIANGEIASYADETLTLNKKGETLVTFDVKINDGEKDFVKSVSLKIVSLGINDVLLADKVMEINYASMFKSKEINVLGLLIDSELFDVSKREVKTEIVEGGDIVSLDGMTVEAKKAGTAKIKVFFTENGNSVEQFITVNVENQSWTLGGKKGQNTFDSNGNLSLKVDSGDPNFLWDNYLVLSDTDARFGTHTLDVVGYSDVRQKMLEKQANYISFTAKVRSGVLRVYAPVLPDGQEYLGISTSGIVTGSKFPDQILQNVGVYTMDGIRLEKHNVLSPDTEYRVVIRYEHESKGWSEVSIKGCAVDATISNVTYHESYDMGRLSTDHWGLKKHEGSSFINKKYTLGGNLWDNYLTLLALDGTNATSSSIARQFMKDNNYNYIEFTIKVESGTARIYAPTLPEGQSYMAISTTGIDIGPNFSDQVLQNIGLYTMDGRRIEKYNTLTPNTEYKVVIRYEHDSKGWSEVCIKGSAVVAMVSDVTYHESYDMGQTGVATWGLKKLDGNNTFVDNKYTLSTDIWTDYLTLIAVDGTTSTSSSIARKYMKDNNYNYVEFTVKVESGTARIYMPVSGAKNTGGTEVHHTYVAISTTGITYADDKIKNYLSIYTLEGDELDDSSTLTANTEYKVRIKYDHEATGWSQISIQGSQTVITVSEAEFKAE